MLFSKGPVQGLRLSGKLRVWVASTVSMEGLEWWWQGTLLTTLYTHEQPCSANTYGMSTECQRPGDQSWWWQRQNNIAAIHRASLISDITLGTRHRNTLHLKTTPCAIIHILQLGKPCSVAQPCLTLRNPMDCSPPGSSVHQISQARIQEWVAISFSRGSSWPRDWTHSLLRLLHWQADSLPLSHLGNPQWNILGHKKKNKIMPSAVTWMDLEIVILS